VANVLGGLFSGRRSRTSITTEYKRNAASQAKVEAAYAKASDAQRAILDLEAELAAEVTSISDTWQATAAAIQPMTIPLEKSDIAVTDFRLVWIPVA
jgi:phage host-nuclease inhibitor protein Gam